MSGIKYRKLSFQHWGRQTFIKTQKNRIHKIKMLIKLDFIKIENFCSLSEL